MAEYRLLPIALTELEEALDWYGARSPRAAQQFAERIEKALESIEQSPNRFPRWDDRHRFRLVDRFPYYVAYRMAGVHPLIVAIRHTSRDQLDLGDR